MDQRKPSSSSNLNSRNPQRPRSASASDPIQNHAAQEHTDSSRVSAQDLLANFAFAAEKLDQAYSSMLSEGYYPSMAHLPRFHGNFPHPNNMLPPQSSPSTSVNFNWHTVGAPRGSKSSTNQPNVPQASPSMNLHSGLPSFLNSPQDSIRPDSTSNPSRRQQRQASGAASNGNSSSPDVELTETERAAASDEKRRRNTAASARFRVKKKHRTIALERAVSDLTGRAEELEREVGDLRRENGWLKEIVVLKGTQNVANNRLALRQAVALATGLRSYGTESTVQEDVSEGSSALSDDDSPAKQLESKGRQGSNENS